MKHSFKIMTTVVAMCTIMAVMMIGIWAATSQTSNVTATLSFTATDVDVQFLGRVTGSATPANDWVQNIESNKVESTTVSWNIGTLSFDSTTKSPIKVGIAMRNNGVETKPYCITSVSTTLPAGVTMTYKQTGGTTAAPYSTTYSSSEFVPSVLTVLSANAASTASSGTTLPYYNPTTSALTTGKVYYYEIVFTLTSWDSDVAPFAIAFGMNVASSKIS